MTERLITLPSPTSVPFPNTEFSPIVDVRDKVTPVQGQPQMLKVKNSRSHFDKNVLNKISTPTTAQEIERELASSAANTTYSRPKRQCNNRGLN